MEGHLQNSPKVGYPINNDDIKYVSGLSTILVATIQEAKDRISQIEYIFCSQLFPNFQLKSKSLQKICSEARKAAADAWKEKENNLLLQIEKLLLEKQQALEENQSLKLEKAKSLKEQEEKMNLQLDKLKSQQLRIDELEQGLMQKSKEVDEGMELQNKLLQLVQTKASVIVNKGKQLKEHEEKTNALLAELNGLEKKVDELQVELREKTEEVARGKELTENLLKKIDFQAFEIMNIERLLTDHGRDKKLPTIKFARLEENVGLKEELRIKTNEVEEGRKIQEQLFQQIEMNGSEILRNKQQLEECEKEKNVLLAKVNSLDEKVAQLQINLKERSGEVAGGRGSYEELLQQIELKAAELLAEKKKGRETYDAYKRMKSQCKYLCKKLGLTTENMLPRNKLEDNDDSLRNHQNPITLPDLENKIPDTSTVVHDTNKAMNEICLENEWEKVIKTSNFQSPTSNFTIAPKCPSSAKSPSASGKKRSASSWRGTRSRQCQGGPDPHDDFLDTPYENIRGNLNKAMKDEVHTLAVPVPKDMTLDGSDDETQDMNVDPNPQEQMPVPMAGERGFKYVEPVRKKAERENLKGIECKQCKKFYDAVLPDNGGKDTDGNKQNFRCEHHDGVSRHRYKYVPPLTPEGFWNIGFESEM